MRYAFIQALEKLAAKDDRVMLLTGDLGFTVFENFASLFPQQFLNMGVAEANMVSVAAGLVSAGKIPFVYSIATFMSMRPFEQIRNDVCAQNLNVKIIAAGGGFSYGHAGLTHHSLEDIAIMRVLPNIKIICPSDPLMVKSVVKTAYNTVGPMYIRLGKSGEPNIHPNLKFKIGKGIILREGNDTALFSTGNMVATALEISSQLEKFRVKATVVELPSIKPIDKELILTQIRKYPSVFSLEEHYRTGGLGTAIAEIISENGIKSKLLRIGVADQFQKIVGDQQYLRQLNQLTGKKAAKTILHNLKND